MKFQAIIFIAITTLLVFSIFYSHTARADCTGPAASAGTQMYNSTYSTMQFCDGTLWHSMKGGGGSPLKALSCANGQIAKWNSATSKWECAADTDTNTQDNLGAGGTTAGTLYTSNGHVGRDSTDEIRFDNDAQAFWKINNRWEYQFYPTNLSPYYSAENDLGTSGKKWKNSYFSGTVNAVSFAGSGAALTGVVKTETDPQVSSVTNGKWCRGNGSAIVCDQAAPSAGGANCGARVHMQIWVISGCGGFTIRQCINGSVVSSGGSTSNCSDDNDEALDDLIFATSNREIILKITIESRRKGLLH